MLTFLKAEFLAYLVTWFEDKGCRLKHERILKTRAAAVECADWLKLYGAVYNVTMREIVCHNSNEIHS